MPAAAATYIVNSSGDEAGSNVGNGRCETAPGNGVCTLRRAIAEADALFPSDYTPTLPRVTIVIAVPSITLTSASPLLLSGYGSLTVMGAGAQQTVIDAAGNSLFASVESGVRRISGLTIRNAATAFTGLGELHLEYVNIETSTTPVYWIDGDVTIVGCRITGATTTALNFTGAGEPHPIVIRDTTLAGNHGSSGGAIWVFRGNLQLDRVTLSQNEAVNGGAIYVGYFKASLAITNSTFSGNTASESGGAIYTEGRSIFVPGGTGAIAHSTFVGNRADSDANGTGVGAVFATASATGGGTFDLALTTSIVADNVKTVASGGGFVPAPGSCDGSLTADGPTLFTVVDCPVAVVAPTVGAAGLGPLQDNGGPTLTHLPQVGSAVIDAAAAPCRDSAGALLTRDQRGLSRQAGSGCDLGAAEASALAVPPGTRHDFNHDGRGDLLWRHRGTGGVAAWLMNGSAVTGAFLPTVEPLLWRISATGDFDGDGTTDLVWRRAVDGLNILWYMAPPAGPPPAPPTIRLAVFLPDLEATPEYSWRARAGDFDADGRDDLLWELRTAADAATGVAAVWLLDGDAVKAARALPVATGGAVLDVGDLDGDGTSDLAWRFADDHTEAWLMAGGSRQSVVPLLTRTGAGWTVAGAVDTSGDGTADLVWRNTATGQNELWLLDGGTPVVASLPTVSPLNWTLATVVDTDGDQRGDLVWQSPRTGQTARWRLNGGTVVSGALLPTVDDPGWNIIP